MTPQNSNNGEGLQTDAEWTEYLNTLFTKEAMKAIDAAVACVPDIPGGCVADWYPPLNGAKDPNELIEHRFLCRGSALLFPGPTGIGKSSLVTQLGFHFAAGLPCLGFRPAQPYQGKGMRVLIIQAENDQFDMNEMIDGIRAGCPEVAAHAEAAKNLHIFNVRGRTGAKFVDALVWLLEEYGAFDLVICDPVLAYLGTDSKDQKGVGHFLRELIDPVIQKYNFGLILCHHTNKPPSGREKPDWQAGDFAYLGSGSIEWANFARSIFALRNVGSSEVFELILGKRGKHLQWKDGEENILRKYIRHAREPGKICWELASAEDIQTLENEQAQRKAGRPKSTPDASEVLRCIDAQPGLSRKAYTDMFGTVQGTSERSLDQLIRQCIDKGWLRFREQGPCKLYTVTDGGRIYANQHPAVSDWAQHWQNLESACDNAT